jgi:hypothetical protein
LAIANQAGLDQGGQANAALIAAANSVQTANQGESSDIRNRVAEMIQWMASTQAHGEDYGQGVAERAREICGACEQHQNGQLDQNQEQEQNGALNQDGGARGAR